MDHLFAELVDLVPEQGRGRRERVFLEWLNLTLEEQYAGLRQYLNGQADPTALLRQWARDRWCEKLIPAAVLFVLNGLWLIVMTIRHTPPRA